MKKFLCVILALTMALSLAACGGKDTADTTAPAASVESSLAALEAIWAKYGEDEKFAVIGGNMESPVDGAMRT